MSERVTVDVPDEVARRARAVAAQTQQRFEDVLAVWLDRAGAEPSMELLPDDEVLAVCDRELEAKQQAELSDLLRRQREGTLSERKRERLDELMGVYRRGLVRKAQALKVAVARGLRPPLE